MFLTSSQPKTQLRRMVRYSAVSMIVLCLCLEGVLRTPLRNLLPDLDVSGWGNERVYESLLRLRVRAPVDILFLPNSYTLFSIKPDWFTSHVKELTGKTYTAFNAGSYLLTMDIAQILLDHALLPANKQSPEYIIYGTSFVEMSVPSFREGIVSQMKGALYGFYVDDSWFSDLQHWLYDNSYLFRYHSALLDLFLRRFPDSPGIDSDGFEGAMQSFDVNSYNPRARDTDTSISFQDDQFRRLATFVGFCQSRGIKVIFVDMPHLPLRFKGNLMYSFHLAEYYRKLKILAVKSGIPLLGLSKIRASWMDNKEYYLNPDHLNYEGAKLMTKRVAQFFVTITQSAMISSSTF